MKFQTLQSIEIFCFTWHNPILYNFRASHFSKLCKVVFGVEDRRRNKIRLNFAISSFLYFPGEQLVLQGNPPALYLFLACEDFTCPKLSVAEYVFVFRVHLFKARRLCLKTKHQAWETIFSRSAHTFPRVYRQKFM